MADFVNPQFNPPPDMMAAYMRGAMAPGMLQGQQQELARGGQELQSGQLNLDMLRQMMAFKAQAMKQELASQQGAAPSQASPTGMEQSPLAAIGNPARLQSDYGWDRITAMGAGKSLLETDTNFQNAQQAAQKTAIEAAKIRAEDPRTPGNPMPMFKSFASMSPDEAAASLANNHELLAGWPTLAKQYGEDPWDKTAIPRVAAMEYNQRGGPLGLSVPVPSNIKNVALGQGQVAQIDQTTGKKVGDLTERQAPTYTLVDKWDPATNTTTKVPVQTGGAGMSGVGPTGQVTGGKSPVATVKNNYPASGATLGFNTGMKAPTDPELKAAMFGSEMRAGLKTIQGLEDNKFSLSVPQRTAFINAATSEDPGTIKQFFSQEYLSKMSPQAQTYIAAMMPMLQAAGHDQSGARLPTSQIRQNIEGLIPPADGVSNPQLMDQINKNRQGFYIGLLGQAGSAVEKPQYKNTLGADLKGVSGNAPESALAHLRAHPELLPQFKAKYGYDPSGK